MSALSKHTVIFGLFALFVGCAQAQEPPPRQFFVTVAISHDSHLVSEGSLVFYAGPLDQPVDKGVPVATSADLQGVGYPAIRCSHAGGTATRAFTSVMLKSGYAMRGSLDTKREEIAIKVQRFDADGATKQVLSEMKKPIQTCRTIEPRQIVSLQQTVGAVRSRG